MYICVHIYIYIYVYTHAMPCIYISYNFDYDLYIMIINMFTSETTVNSRFASESPSLLFWGSRKGQAYTWLPGPALRRFELPKGILNPTQAVGLGFKNPRFEILRIELMRTDRFVLENMSKLDWQLEPSAVVDLAGPLPRSQRPAGEPTSERDKWGQY